MLHDSAALVTTCGGAPAERTRAICRAAMRCCLAHGWAALTEVPLASGRRADLLALRPDGGFAIIEVKSGARDFQTDAKWPEYRDWCDRLYFAIDLDFPQALLPTDVGLLIADGAEAILVRDGPCHALAPARRRALLHRFASLGARRLAQLNDPALLSLRDPTRPD